MTKLLVSVRNASEALAALEGGADLIDIKEPLHGSLGAASSEAIAEVIQAVAGRRRVSAALGELLQLDDAASVGRRTLEALRADLAAPRWAKIGLSGCANLRDWRARWRGQLVQLPAECAAVAVIYADEEHARSPGAQDILRAAQELGCRAILVDTFRKDGRSLLQYWSLDRLLAFTHEARAAGFMVVLAGSLSLNSIPEVLGAEPDFIAVRGAACEGSRESTISSARVRGLKHLLQRVRVVS